MSESPYILSRTQQKLLHEMFFKRKVTISDIVSAKIVTHRPSAFRIIKELKALGLVKDKYAKGKKVFSLNVEGLIYGLVLSQLRKRGDGNE